MALIPTPRPSQVILQTEGGGYILSADGVIPSRLLLQTESGQYLLDVTDGVVVKFLMATEGGLSQVGVEMVEEDLGDVVTLRFDYTTGKNYLATTKVVLSVATSLDMRIVPLEPTWGMWVPEIRHAYPTLSYGTGLAVFYNPSLASRYSVGKLTFKDYSLGMRYGAPTYETKYAELKTSYEMRSYQGTPWERMLFEFPVTTGVLEQRTPTLDLASGMGVLAKLDRQFGLATNFGILTNYEGGFGLEYAAAIISPPVFGQWSLGYDVDKFQDTGYEVLDLTLSWEQQATAQKLDFNFGYAQTYAATSWLGSAYARHFFVEFIQFSLTANKERFLWSSTKISVPFSIGNGVSLVCGAQTKVLAGVAIPAQLLAHASSGIAIDCNTSHVIGAAVVQLRLDAIIQYGVTLDMAHIPHIVGGVTLALPIRTVVVGGTQMVYDLLSYTPVTNGVTLSSPISDVAPIVQSTDYVLEDPTGISTAGIKLLRAEIVAEEGSYGWSGTFILENPLDLNKFTAHSLFDFVIGADTYVFMVDSKSLNRSGPAEREATLKGISPSASLVAPRAKLISKTWTDTTTAHAVMQEVLDGYPAQIEILNWPLPANRYGVESTAPMDILVQLAEAVGGIVDTLPNGTLRIRPKYYASTNTWGPNLVDHVYSDFDDIFTSTDDDAPIRVFDKFRVMDAEVSESGDRLEYTEVTPTSGEVRAYPHPWRTTCFLDTTSPSCSIGAATVEYRDVEETIEIYNGEGSVQYPVNAVVSLVWLERDLLGVVAGDDSTKITSTHATEKFSLLKIKYTTRCLVYTVTGYVGQQAQFLLRNP